MTPTHPLFYLIVIPIVVLIGIVWYSNTYGTFDFRNAAMFPFYLAILIIGTFASRLVARIFDNIKAYLVCHEPVTAVFQSYISSTDENFDMFKSGLFAPAWQYEYNGRPYSVDLGSTTVMDGTTRTIYINPDNPREVRGNGILYAGDILSCIFVILFLCVWLVMFMDRLVR